MHQEQCVSSMHQIFRSAGTEVTASSGKWHDSFFYNLCHIFYSTLTLTLTRASSIYFMPVFLLDTVNLPQCSNHGHTLISVCPPPPAPPHPSTRLHNLSPVASAPIPQCGRLIGLGCGCSAGAQLQVVFIIVQNGMKSIGPKNAGTGLTGEDVLNKFSMN